MPPAGTHPYDVVAYDTKDYKSNGSLVKSCECITYYILFADRPLGSANVDFVEQTKYFKNS